MKRKWIGRAERLSPSRPAAIHLALQENGFLDCRIARRKENSTARPCAFFYRELRLGRLQRKMNHHALRWPRLDRFRFQANPDAQQLQDRGRVRVPAYSHAGRWPSWVATQSLQSAPVKP